MKILSWRQCGRSPPHGNLWLPGMPADAFTHWHKTHAFIKRQSACVGAVNIKPQAAPPLHDMPQKHAAKPLAPTGGGYKKRGQQILILRFAQSGNGKWTFATFEQNHLRRWQIVLLHSLALRLPQQWIHKIVGQKGSFEPNVCAGGVVFRRAGGNRPCVGITCVHTIALCLSEPARRVNGAKNGATLQGMEQWRGSRILALNGCLSLSKTAPRLAATCPWRQHVVRADFSTGAQHAGHTRLARRNERGEIEMAKPA